MEISIDYIVNQTNVTGYKIMWRNVLYMFRLTTSYRKRSGSWEIGSISPMHTGIITNPMQDHHKINSQLICDEILSVISKDSSLNMSIIIMHIVTRYIYTPPYMKTCIAKTKAFERVFGNWKDSYKELTQYLVALNHYDSGTVAILETLLTYTSDETCVSDNGIFHRFFWAYEPCIKGFSFCKTIIQIDETWLYGKYKGMLLMVVTQDGNNNIFPTAFSLVEWETVGGWNRYPSIESAYKNVDNALQDPPSTQVYCIRHIARNFMREIKDKTLQKKVVNA
ncbi:uncharacterized protein LOC127082574 [Lathyrus oleraceus]|uniref:uncharacterized protein LOC127082574 n=1 Tax=Pisum sativum TaxID=3888 RepID=UPI0021D0EAD6|nr:uncharacterized protein LOC127082574 [Pisum sativum]